MLDSFSACIYMRVLKSVPLPGVIELGLQGRYTGAASAIDTMKRPAIDTGFLAISAVAIVCFVGSRGFSTNRNGATGDPSSAESAHVRVDQLFTKWNKPDSPGCSVAVSRNGVPIYERGYGMANLELGVKITPKSVFHVASVSKQFTAMSILLLAQGGRATKRLKQ